MPRTVDHEQRRAELGAAVRRVVARDGLEAATVRAVAAEAGWSMGALRYYFSTQDELLDFAFDAMVSDITARVRQLLQTRAPGLDRAQLLLEQLLPLDDDRLAEVRVHLAFMARERTLGRPGRAEQVWQGERHVCAAAVADVTGQPTPEPVGTVPEELEQEVTRLQLLVDGLTFQGVTVPAQLPPERARTLLREALTDVAGGPARAPDGESPARPGH